MYMYMYMYMCMYMYMLLMHLRAFGGGGRLLHTGMVLAAVCETYSTLALGTLCADRFGGPQRRGSEEAYAPVRGRRGATARRADRLVGRVFGWLHRHASRG